MSINACRSPIGASKQLAEQGDLHRWAN